MRHLHARAANNQITEVTAEIDEEAAGIDLSKVEATVIAEEIEIVVLTETRNSVTNLNGTHKAALAVNGEITGEETTMEIKVCTRNILNRLKV